MKSKIAYILIAALFMTCAGCGSEANSGIAQPESAGTEIGQTESALSGAGQTAAIESKAGESGLAAAESGVSESGLAAAESGVSESGLATPAESGLSESGIATAMNPTGSETEVASSVADAEPAEAEIDEQFYAIQIPDEVFESMKGKTYKDYCTVPREDLRYVHVLHKNIYGETLEGELVCHEMIAEDLLEIFRALYDGSYPIEKIRLMDVYDADDETGMTDNNSSCFNYRTISHTNRISKHGLGVAVDINTLYNPYTKVVDGKRIIEPAAGEPYLDRDADFPYKLVEGDLCWQLFTEHGFEWGGAWSDRKDYQHFELPSSITDGLQARYE